MSLIKQGSTGLFDTTMSSDITRLCDLELISVTVTFTTLEFQFPSNEAQEISGTTVTWPNGCNIRLRQVSKFQVNTGTVLAHFHYPKAS